MPRQVHQATSMCLTHPCYTPPRSVIEWKVAGRRWASDQEVVRTRLLSKSKWVVVWPLNDRYHFWRSSALAGWLRPRASFTRN